MTIYCYSKDEELYHGDCGSVEEAVDEGSAEFEDEEISTIYVGEKVAIKMSDLLPDFTRIMEQVTDSAYDEIGEFVSDYGFKGVKGDWHNIPTNTTAQQIEADFAAIFEKYGIKPNFYKVGKVTEHKARL